MSKTILPGSVIGVLGSGQLGRMFTIAARQMGYRVHVLSPDDDTPTGQVADVEFRADYEDLDRVTEFAQGVDVVTFEFENVPAATTETASRYAPVYPAGRVLHTTQNRLREKTFLQSVGLSVTPFAPVRTSSDFDIAVNAVGLPAVLKTAAWGYDGKGQAQVTARDQLVQAWHALGDQEAVLERWVDFTDEISVVAARATSGEIACYDPIGNVHRNHILDVSTSPAEVPPSIATAAVEIVREVMNKLEVVGVLCVEFFVAHDGALLINELAPRPHNSGHLTIDAHVTSQFEQQVRAVCGLPPGSTEQLRPAAMVNLLGDLWTDGEPAWPEVCRTPGVSLHLYGKQAPRKGRKMGHLTALADSTRTAAESAILARRRLIPPIATPHPDSTLERFQSCRAEQPHGFK